MVQVPCVYLNHTLKAHGDLSSGAVLKVRKYGILDTYRPLVKRAYQNSYIILEHLPYFLRVRSVRETRPRGYKT